MESIIIPQDILILCRNIERLTAGYNVYLAGGYLRDLEHSDKAPKDVDLFFVPKKDADLKYLPIGLVGLGDPLYDHTSPTQDMKDRGVERVVCFVNDNLSTPEINYIVYNRPLTMEELALDFDMGINQIAYDILERKLFRSENYIDHHKQKVIHCLHKFSEERMYHRYKRMKEKFPEYITIGEPEVGIIDKLVYEMKSALSSRRAQRASA